MTSSGHVATLDTNPPPAPAEIAYSGGRKSSQVSTHVNEDKNAVQWREYKLTEHTVHRPFRVGRHIPPQSGELVAVAVVVGRWWPADS